ncbi:MAG TPA: rhodanese-like domain-containing protein [Roseateles sp.]|nr:rhodanese-like domain-containing protein [Roseateles sp.]
MDPQQHISFYRFVAIADPQALAERLRAWGDRLGGNILLAPEGISGALGGAPAALDAFEAALRAEPGLAGLDFKRSDCTTRPFTLLKVHVKPEIVAFGVPGVSGLPEPGQPDSHVSPARWRELLDDPAVLVIDNRNSFEFKLGRFRNAIDPEVTHFRDFPAYVAAHAEGWKQSGRKIAMYCTGGIRCEKTAAWMQTQGLAVYQLEGGILNYFQAMPDAAADWQGECFVFDKRIAIDTKLQETATTAEQVYADEPPWRLARARRLDPDT